MLKDGKFRTRMHAVIIILPSAETGEFIRILMYRCFAYRARQGYRLPHAPGNNNQFTASCQKIYNTYKIYNHIISWNLWSCIVTRKYGHSWIKPIAVSTTRTCDPRIHIITYHYPFGRQTKLRWVEIWSTLKRLASLTHTSNISRTDNNNKFSKTSAQLIFRRCSRTKCTGRKWVTSNTRGSNRRKLFPTPRFREQPEMVLQ